jgi:hypothetical protein
LLIRQWRWWTACIWFAVLAAPVGAQTTDAWTWDASARVFFGYNYQLRKFTDFAAWESQNWLMGAGERPLEGGTLRLSSMLSLEPFTLEEIGSPQVFQTGEAFHGAPLIDYQHPHDLLMGLGADYRRAAGRVTYIAGVDLVGSPTLGPPVFMHRPSAADNPQAPLGHHHLDSTHITPGVVRGGVEAGAWRVEGSWFHGREPDEDRTDLDLGPLDSGAVRVAWAHGEWSAQVSAAFLEEPEAITPFDAKKLTASLARTSGDGRIAWMAAFGQKREIHGNLEAYLFEANVRATPSNILYARVESVAKDILDAGFHPGAFHRHRQSQVGALTGGYVREVQQSALGAFGVGGDVTGYLVPDNLEESYGSPVSFHVFVRYSLPPQRGSHGGGGHVH